MKSKLNDLIRNGVFRQANISQLSKNNFANLFNVINKGEKSYFNLCKGISFDNIDSMDHYYYVDYLVLENDSWTNISYKHYNTTELWWLICKFNGVKNPFEELTPGTYIKVPTDELKDTILNIIVTI
jgi:nucleoid-associated protein YgaU